MLKFVPPHATTMQATEMTRDCEAIYRYLLQFPEGNGRSTARDERDWPERLKRRRYSRRPTDVLLQDAKIRAGLGYHVQREVDASLSA
jgi:hypothetical protein